MARKRPGAAKLQDGDSSAVSIAGYTAVQLQVEAGEKPESGRWIYVRAHAPGVLFLANLPPGTDTGDVRRAVPAARDNESAVELRTMPGNITKFARIFLRGGEADVKAALESPKDWLALEVFAQAEGTRDACPAETWLKQYWEARDEGEIAKWSAATMETFERQEELQEEARKREAANAARPDDDGFVVVRRGSSSVDPSGSVVVSAFNPTLGNESRPQKKKRQAGVTLDGFYRWQRRETRQKEVQELRKRFEDDKKRVAAVRNLDIH
jgi:hypothetical protein